MLRRIVSLAKRNQQIRSLVRPAARALESTPAIRYLFKLLVTRVGNGKFDPRGFVRLTTADPYPAPVLGTLNLIRYAVHSGSAYAGTEFPAGYHTLKLDSYTIPGQRDPRTRLDAIKSAGLDLSGLRILDIGSNQGGICFAALDYGAKWCVGVDYDPRMVNAANRLSATRLDANRSTFYTFDIDTDPHELIVDMLPEASVDVTFLLSVCAWVRNWPDLLVWVSSKSPILVFESNGTVRDQAQQVTKLGECYHKVERIGGNSSDDGRPARTLYLCSSPRTRN